MIWNLQISADWMNVNSRLYSFFDFHLFLDSLDITDAYPIEPPRTIHICMVCLSTQSERADYTSTACRRRARRRLPKCTDRTNVLKRQLVVTSSWLESLRRACQGSRRRSGWNVRNICTLGWSLVGNIAQYTLEAYHRLRGRDSYYEQITKTHRV